MAIQKEINIKVNTGTSEAQIKGIKNELKSTAAAGSGAAGSLTSSFTMFNSSLGRIIPMLNALKVALISTGVGAFLVAAGALVSLFAAATAKGTEFAKAMSGLKAVMGGTDEDMRQLSESAKLLGASTAFSAVQVSELQTELAKLGFTTGEILNATEATLNLATALDTDLASAATLSGGVLRGFGLEASEAQRVADVLSLSASKSALGFSEISEAMKNVIVSAKATGQTLEGTTAMLGILADNQQKGGRGGTALSSVFVELNKKGIKLEDAFKKVSSAANSKDGLNTAMELVGTVGGKALQILANNTEKLPALQKELENSSNAFDGIGAAANNANIRLDNLSGDTTKLGSAWEGFLLNIEDGQGVFSRLARKGVQLLTSSLDGLTFSIDFLTIAWDSIESAFNNSVHLINGGVAAAFTGLGAKIKIFANEALLAISSIPIIGGIIDKETAERNIKSAENTLKEANARLTKIGKGFAEQGEKLATIYERAKNKGVERVKTAALKASQDAELESDAETIALTEEQRKKAAEAEKKRLQEVQKFREKLQNQQRDIDAKSEEDKLSLERKRAQEELDRLVTTTKEKRELQSRLTAFYDQKDREFLEARDKKIFEEQQKQTITDEKAKDDLKKSLRELSDLQKIEEDRKNALEVFKQGNATQEEILQLELQFLDKKNKLIESKEREKNKALADARAEQRDAELDAISSGVNILGTFAKKSKALQVASLIAENAAGIAKNIINTNAANARLTLEGGVVGAPALITANNIRMGVGIASSIAATAKAVSQLGGGAGSSSGGGGATAPSAPSFNLVAGTGSNQIAQGLAQQQQPVQAFVVASNVTSAQSLNRNIVNTASL
jgi:hypothetical protein